MASERVRLVTEAAARWSRELTNLGGPDALSDLSALEGTYLDLTAAHPSGIAQLYAGRPTRLSNVVRESTSLAAARIKAAEVAGLAFERAAHHGLPSIYLAIGTATWTATPTPNGSLRRLPVLLRPLTLTVEDSDLEIGLEAYAELNPVLVRELEAAGASFDPAELAAQTFHAGSFNPGAALATIRSLGAAALPGFKVAETLIVGVFQNPGHLPTTDLATAGSALARRPVIAALAGDPAARSTLAAQDLPAPVQGDRLPSHERGIGDLDPAQQHILDVSAAGYSFTIAASPESPVPQTVAAIIADAVGSGRSVLYVAGSQEASRAVVGRLREARLDEAMLDLVPQADWQRSAVARLQQGIFLPGPRLDVRGIETVRAVLEERSRQISAYVTALHTRRETWGVSAYDVLQHLAAVSDAHPSVRTRVRLDETICLKLLEGGRESARASIARCAELGMFRLRPADTAWYGADIATSQAGSAALEHLDRVRGQALTETMAHMRQVAVESGLDTPKTLAGWGEQLDMLAGIRQALDVFLPIAFERSPQDMVAATASPQWRTDHDTSMNGVMRRRLRKQAKDLVRPGRVVDNLHDELVRLQSQREVWVRWCPAGAWPRLPDSMAQIDAAYRAVRADIEALSAVLSTIPDAVPLDQMPWDDLVDQLDRLDASRDWLDFLPELTRLGRELEAAGLTPLVEDLRMRRIGPAPHVGEGAGDAAPGSEEADNAGAELDLAWWRSVLLHIMNDDPALAGLTAPTLAGVIASFRELDRAHIASKPGPIRAALARSRAQARTTYPGQTAALSGFATSTALREAVASCPDVAMKARPCWVVSPLMVSYALPFTEQADPVADIVILDDARHIPVSRAIGALARGSQVIAVCDLADVRDARPTPPSGPAAGRPAANPPNNLSVCLAAFLPHLDLAARPSRRDPRLTRFLAEAGWAVAGAPLPLPVHDELITFSYLDATGQATPDGDAIEVPGTEVAEVVRQIALHCAAHPDESLAVITASPRHTARIKTALVQALASPEVGAELIDAADPKRPEPLAIIDLAHARGLSRDAAIFCPGFAKTPHGRVLHDFGPISGPDGATALIQGLLVARHRLVVVSCLRAGELDPLRLTGEGPLLFARFLAFMAHPDTVAPSAKPTLDALLTDLTSRLRRRGLLVEAGSGIPGGQVVPLTVSRPGYGAVPRIAILTDDADFVAEPSNRVRIRHRAEQLERLGWKVVQEWSTALFFDPEAEAQLIATTAE